MYIMNVYPPAPACKGPPGCEAKLASLQLAVFLLSSLVLCVTKPQLPIRGPCILSSCCSGVSQLVFWDW